MGGGVDGAAAIVQLKVFALLPPRPSLTEAVTEYGLPLDDPAEGVPLIRPVAGVDRQAGWQASGAVRQRVGVAVGRRELQAGGHALLAGLVCRLGQYRRMIRRWSGVARQSRLGPVGMIEVDVRAAGGDEAQLCGPAQVDVQGLAAIGAGQDTGAGEHGAATHHAERDRAVGADLVIDPNDRREGRAAARNGQSNLAQGMDADALGVGRARDRDRAAVGGAGLAVAAVAFDRSPRVRLQRERQVTDVAHRAGAGRVRGCVGRRRGGRNDVVAERTAVRPRDEVVRRGAEHLRQRCAHAHRRADDRRAGEGSRRCAVAGGELETRRIGRKCQVDRLRLEVTAHRRGGASAVTSGEAELEMRWVLVVGSAEAAGGDAGP